jgi:nucleoside-triphosphatase THEP1
VHKPLSSPVSFLASFLSKSENEEAPELWLVTGESGAGKSSWCQELVRRGREAGLTPVGLISPAVFQDGRKVGIDLIEVETGERRRLATKKEDKSSPSTAGLSTQAWDFDTETLAWGNRILERLVPATLLILDELGPLEILDGKGLTAGLRLIDQKQYRLACVVIRPRLLPTALERWPWSKALEIPADKPGGLPEAGEA